MTSITETLSWGCGALLNKSEETSVQLLNWSLKNSCISKINHCAKFESDSTASLWKRITKTALAAIAGIALFFTALPFICQSVCAKIRDVISSKFVCKSEEPDRS